ncbi:MAG: apolipoprotein N-acyltransferase [Bdellovibrio sp.]|nr:apolipoprotein N-acyltransferase [Methylotenera sp.]
MNHALFKTIHLQSFFVCVLLGALTVLGFAPFYIFAAPIIALIGLIYFWAKTESAKSRFLLGFCFGLGLYCVGIYWIYISLHDFGGMPWWFAGLCTFCLCAFMALFPALVGFFSARFGFLMLSAPILWGLSDWTRSWIFTGFPWLTMGYSQVPHSPLAGYMPIVGVYGVSVMTVFISTIIGLWFANKNQTILFKRNAIAAITLFLIAGFILKAVEWATPIGKPISVALLQGNIAQDEKWSIDAAQSTIDQYMQMIMASKAQLIVTPETALPVISSQMDASISQTLSSHAKQNGGDILVGLVQVNSSVTQPDYDRYYNSAISFGSAPTQAYSKNHLVPFGEFIPLKQIFGWIYRDYLNIPLSDLSRGGAQQTPMNLLNHDGIGQKIAINICYEDVFGEEIIRQLPAATLMVNMTNDAWYGQSYAADQHMQFSQARALETGRFMLRATNTGATAAIDQHGYVLAHAPHFTKTTLNVLAQGYTGSTPYVAYGNWPFIVFCFSVLAYLLWRKRPFLR